MASEQRRVLIVGAGSIGERHARCFKATGRAHVGLADVNAELLSTVAGRYELTDVYANLADAIEAGFDAAVIATPAPLHIPMARQLAEAGVDLLIEKPLALKTDGIDDLRESIITSGVTVGVAYVYRAHPSLASMRQAILSGRFGKPLQITSICGQNFPFYRPAFRNTYYAKRESGGGAVQDALTHVINAAEWLVGPMTRVAADVDRLALTGVEVEDTVHVIARHGAVMANYSMNQHQAPFEMTITVACERGTARFEMHQNRWLSMTTPGSEWAVESAETFERDTLFRAQADAFLDAVDGTKPPLCSFDDGAQTLRANIAILRSADNGTWENVEAGKVEVKAKKLATSTAR